MSGPYVAALVITVVIGSVNILCLGAVFFLRSTPVFAARVPKLVLGSLLAKIFSFAFCAWLLLDTHCPCWVVSLMFWAEWVGNCWIVAKRCVLLFRYEIQAALDKSKNNVAPLDEKNFFVRYRTCLRPRTQGWIMFIIFILVGAGFVALAGVYHNQVVKTCTYDSWVDDRFLLGVICFGWVVSAPMMTCSIIATVRLRKFPKDNWKMGTENSFTAIFTILGAISCIIMLIANRSFDGLLWVFFVGSVFVVTLQSVLPASLHRQTLKQLIILDLKNLTSLDQLLLNDEFLKSFEKFLRKEFSDENLFFWLEVNRLQAKYGSALFSNPQSPEEEEEKEEDKPKLLERAAHECSALGTRFVGDLAPSQLNISGDTVDDLGLSLLAVDELIKDTDKTTHELETAVETVFKALSAVQREVYELLRKDPYPRFLLTTEGKKLNENSDLKRTLASEKLEQEVISIHQKRSDTTGEHSSRSSESERKSKSRGGSEMKKPNKTRSSFFGFGRNHNLNTSTSPRNFSRTESFHSEADDASFKASGVLALPLATTNDV